MSLLDVLIVPELGQSLLSVPKLATRGGQAILGSGDDSHIKMGVLKLPVEYANGLYTWTCKPQRSSAIAEKESVQATAFTATVQRAKASGQVIWEKKIFPTRRRNARVEPTSRYDPLPKRMEEFVATAVAERPATEELPAVPGVMPSLPRVESLGIQQPEEHAELAYQAVVEGVVEDEPKSSGQEALRSRKRRRGRRTKRSGNRSQQPGGNAYKAYVLCEHAYPAAAIEGVTIGPKSYGEASRSNAQGGKRHTRRPIGESPPASKEERWASWQ